MLPSLHCEPRYRHLVLLQGVYFNSSIAFSFPFSFILVTAMLTVLRTVTDSFSCLTFFHLPFRFFFFLPSLYLPPFPFSLLCRATSSSALAV